MLPAVGCAHLVTLQQAALMWHQAMIVPSLPAQDVRTTGSRTTIAASSGAHILSPYSVKHGIVTAGFSSKFARYLHNRMSGGKHMHSINVEGHELNAWRHQHQFVIICQYEI